MGRPRTVDDQVAALGGVLGALHALASEADGLDEARGAVSRRIRLTVTKRTVITSATMVLAAGFCVMFIGGGARFAIGLTLKSVVEEFG